jgi:hypothetical protein
MLCNGLCALASAASRRPISISVCSKPAPWPVSERSSCCSAWGLILWRSGTASAISTPAMVACTPDFSMKYHMTRPSTANTNGCSPLACP